MPKFELKRFETEIRQYVYIIEAESAEEATAKLEKDYYGRCAEDAYEDTEPEPTSVHFDEWEIVSAEETR
jgi:hypothetical protein